MQTLQIVQCQALGGETASHEAQKCHLSPIFPDGTIMCLNIKLNNIFPDGTIMCLHIKLNNIIFPDGTKLCLNIQTKQYNISRRNYNMPEHTNKTI